MDAWRDSSFATPFVGVGSHRRTGEHGEKALMTLWKTLVVALVAAFALAACSSSDNGGGTDTGMMEPTPQETCEDGGGRWNADETCTSAEALAMERAEMQRGAIQTAISGAETAVAGVDDDSTESEVNAANTAVADARTAITNAAEVPQAEKDANTRTVDAIANRLTAALESRTAAMTAADEQRMKDNAKLGKDLHAALGGPDAGGNALANIDTATTPVSLGATGLVIDAAAGAGSLATDANHDSETLEAGDSAGALGSWNGTDYMHMEGTGDNKVANEARVYTNQGPGTRQAFADGLPDGVTIATDNTGGTTPANVNPATTAIKGYIAVSSGGTITTGLSFDNVMAAAFTHSGTQDHAIPEERNSFSARGTYDGAPGEYRCVTGCSSTNNGTGSPSGLGGTWFFKPDAGAMVHQPDGHYLYYGWWVRKDSDGMPTAASAFAGRVGTDATDGTDNLDPGWTGAYTAGTTLTGSATYEGHAAGKYAIDNVLDGTGHGGHFTADATLEATFSGDADDVGITGTIDSFRLNDGSDDPGWSVSLHRSAFGSDGAITGSTADLTNTTAEGTTWSFGDNAAPESGTWSGNMYDEAVTGDDNDGSNVPTTVTGTFYSEFSTIGRMVGAFGAEAQ